MRFRNRARHSMRAVIVAFIGFCLATPLLTAAAPSAPGKIVFVSHGDIFAIDSNGQNRHNLTNHPAEDASPVWSPDGTQIAFVSNREGNWNIYLMGGDGQNPRKLPNQSGDNDSPAWSPDGQRIAFISNRDTETANVFNIYQMSGDGANVRWLTDPKMGIRPIPYANSLTWLPGNLSVAYVTQPEGLNGFPVYWLDTKPYHSRFLLNSLTLNSASIAALCWLPGSDRFVVQANTSAGESLLYLSNQGATWVRLITAAFAEARAPTPSPDGALITFLGAGPEGKGVYVMRVDGTSPRRLVAMKSLPDSISLAWSPDNQSLALGGDTLSLIDVKTGSASVLLNEKVESLAWQPVGAVLPILETPTPTPMPTVGHLSLAVGGRASVSVLDDGLSLRAGPGVNFRLIEKLPNGTLVTLIDGPKAGGDYVWWKVQAPSGHEGWVVEAADGRNTLLPKPAK